MSTDNTIPTTLPCPEWCVLPVGHPFHGLTPDGLLQRTHEGPDRSIGSVDIGLCADEIALGDNGPADTTEAPRRLDAGRRLRVLPQPGPAPSHRPGG